MRTVRWACGLLACFSLCGAAAAQTSAVARKTASSTAAPAEVDLSGAQKTLSTRIVAYLIDAKLDPKKHTIDATETLSYLNLTGQPQQTFPFHLYLNAFQPQSTFMTEVHRSGTRGNGPGSAWDPLHYGAIKVSNWMRMEWT